MEMEGELLLYKVTMGRDGGRTIVVQCEMFVGGNFIQQKTNILYFVFSLAPGWDIILSILLQIYHPTLANLTQFNVDKRMTSTLPSPYILSPLQGTTYRD